MQQKKADTGLLEELDFTWQEESWDSPETVGSEDTRDDDPEFPTVEELIQVVLRSNNGDPDTKLMGPER